MGKFGEQFPAGFEPLAEALVLRSRDDGRLSALLHNNLGAAHDLRGDHPMARKHYERALELLARGTSGLDPLLVVTHHNLGGMYLDEGRLAQARVHYTRARALCTEILGDRHPLGAHPLAGIGDVDAREAAYAHAQRSYNEALALMVASYGPDHLYLLHPLAGLGRVHAATGQVDEARRSYERAVAIAEMQHSAHPLVAEALEGLAELAATGGEPGRARSLFERAVEIHAASPDRDALRHATAALRAGEVAQDMGDARGAAGWFEHVLAEPGDAPAAIRGAAALHLASALVAAKTDRARACALLARARADLPADDPRQVAVGRLRGACG